MTLPKPIKLTALDITTNFAITGLERFILLDKVLSLKAGTIGETAQKMDLLRALCARDWDLDARMASGLQSMEFDTVHELTMTKAHLKTAQEVVKQAIENSEANQPQWVKLYELYERIGFVLSEV